MAIAPAAVSVSALALDQASGAATVILPACVPAAPDDTVTLARPSAVTSVVALMIESLPVATKPLVSAALEIVTLNGSSSKFPVRPRAAVRSAKPE